MFIKIFTPNENGKIELTTKELETLIQEAVDKASIDKCSKCTRGWSLNNHNRVTTVPSITLLGDDSDGPRRNGEITWGAANYINPNYVSTTDSLCEHSNKQLQFDFGNTKEN